MSAEEPSIPVTEMLSEGLNLAAIAAAWSLLAAIAWYGVANIGQTGPGALAYEMGHGLAWLFVVVGLANVLLYVIACGLRLGRARQA